MTPELATQEQLATHDAVQEKTLTTDERLAQLAQRVNEAHLKVPNALRYGLICAYEAGQGLLEAHQICPNRKWLAWLAANFQFSRATAARYMDFATECDRLGLNVSMLSKIPPAEASAALKKLTVLPSGKKKAKATNGPLVHPVAKAEKKNGQKPPAGAAVAPTEAEPRPAAAEQVGGNPFPRLAQFVSGADGGPGSRDASRQLPRWSDGRAVAVGYQAGLCRLTGLLGGPQAMVRLNRH